MGCIGMGEGCAAIHRTTNRMPAFTIRGCDKGLNGHYVRAHHFANLVIASGARQSSHKNGAQRLLEMSWGEQLPLNSASAIQLIASRMPLAVVSIE